MSAGFSSPQAGRACVSKSCARLYSRWPDGTYGPGHEGSRQPAATVGRARRPRHARLPRRTSRQCVSLGAYSSVRRGGVCTVAMDAVAATHSRRGDRRLGRVQPDLHWRALAGRRRRGAAIGMFAGASTWLVATRWPIRALPARLDWRSWVHRPARTPCQLAVLRRDRLDSEALLSVAAQQTARLEERRPRILGDAGERRH